MRTRARAWLERAVVVMVLSWCSAHPGSARASELRWSGPSGCSERDELLFQVERALGRSLARVGHHDIEVRVERLASKATALLRISGEEGLGPVSERRLVAADCRALVETAAVAITLALEPPTVSAASEAPASSPLAAVAEESRASAVPTDSRDSAEEPAELAPPEELPASRAPGPSARGVAALVVDTGTMPAFAAGVALALQLAWPRVQLEALGTLWVAQEGRLAASSVAGAGAELGLATGALSGCVMAAHSSTVLEGWLCTGAEVGRLSGYGLGVTEPRRASALWFAPTLHALISWRPLGGALGLEARLGVAAPLARNAFILEDLGRVHQPASMAVRGGIGARVVFR